MQRNWGIINALVLPGWGGQGGNGSITSRNGSCCCSICSALSFLSVMAGPVAPNMSYIFILHSICLSSLCSVITTHNAGTLGTLFNTYGTWCGEVCVLVCTILEHKENQQPIRLEGEAGRERESWRTQDTLPLQCDLGSLDCAHTWTYPLHSSTPFTQCHVPGIH